MQLTKSIFCLLLITGSAATQALPEIQTWTTRNGAQVYFVPAQQLPMVDVRVLFDAGSARDGDKPGRALLTNALLAEGAGNLDADAIARRFEDVGAVFGNDSLRDMSLITLRTLNKPELMKQAVDTAALVLNQPTFPPKALERERQRLLIGLRSETQDPEAIADKAFFAALYGDHPYAKQPTGDERSVKSLTRADLLNHYKRYYVGKNAVVAIVGDLDRAVAGQLAEQLAGSLPAGEAAPTVAPAPALEQGAHRHVAFPSSQTHILIGQPGMRRNDPDYFPLYVGNHILGGAGLVSRISDELREKRGLAYSAYSYFTPMRVEGPYTLGLQTATANADKAVEVMRQILTAFMGQGPSAQELEASKKNITGGFPLNIDSNSDIVQYLSMIGFYRLPLDYLNTFNAKVQAVTIEQIRDAFRRRVHPESMMVVTVGKGP